MKNDYRRTATTVLLVNYHFVFCPRYRRKIFLIDGLEDRFKELAFQKISRAIVNDAITYGVGIIKLESLSGIRASARKSRKNNHSLHSWSFYRLAKFIEYKAELAGIEVVYVDPAYTSQTCPICGGVHHAQDRIYICPDCGYRTHRDVLGARNIMSA